MSGEQKNTSVPGVMPRIGRPRYTGLGPRSGIFSRYFALQQAPVSRVQLKGCAGLVAALLRGGAEQRLNRAFRFVGHSSY